MSLSWFTTVPGLLITGGVLLLVIALIIFVVTSVKDLAYARDEISKTGTEILGVVIDNCGDGSVGHCRVGLLIEGGLAAGADGDLAGEDGGESREIL